MQVEEAFQTVDLSFNEMVSGLDTEEELVVCQLGTMAFATKFCMSDGYPV